MKLNSFQKNILLTIAENYNYIICNNSINKKKLLWTLAGIESSFGKNVNYRYEKAFDIGGKYYNEKIKRLKNKYGKGACCSNGVWQLLFITANELGYKGLPRNLIFPEIQIKYVIRFINQRLKGFNDLIEFADGYNSGNYKDENKPKEYIKKFIKIYNEIHTEELNGYWTI